MANPDRVPRPAPPKMAFDHNPECGRHGEALPPGKRRKKIAQDEAPKAPLRLGYSRDSYPIPA
ncbi:hypothetical protein ACE7GA_01460 [Roseomonas sp. CCTCC AB2023176]|uniref:hypothetical protein n=1 Tax=Roseomonas sp. CCTCC AB2023176 TaxID=3342640 RepID=UPI0035DC736D